MTYYKVVNFIDKEVLINTKQTNYSLTLVNWQKYARLLEYIIDKSRIDDLPLDFYFTLYNNIAILENDYLDSIPDPEDGRYELSDLTHQPNHKYLFITRHELINLLDNLIILLNEQRELGFNAFLEGNYLWEYIFENVRVSKYSTMPSRLNSVFLFKERTACQYYIETAKGGGEICEVELKNTDEHFEGDMKLLDNIPNYSSTNRAEIAAELYWQGELTDEPIVEILFQGECIFRPM